MSHLLWKFFFEEDVDSFRETLAQASISKNSRPQKNKAATTLGSSPATQSGSLASPSADTHVQRRSGHSHNSKAKLPISRGITISHADLNWKDLSGATLLHRIASSASDTAFDFAEALLKLSSLDIHIQDEESGWTALHRALYAGNVNIAHALLHRDTQDALSLKSASSGPASSLIKIKDHEGYSPFDVFAASYQRCSSKPNFMSPLSRAVSGSQTTHQHQEFEDDSLDPFDQHFTAPDSIQPEIHLHGDEYFSFGSNKNLTLGLSNGDDRQYPEKVSLQRPQRLLNRFLDEFLERSSDDSSSRKKQQPFGLFELPANVRFRNLQIQDVQLAKYHSAVLTGDLEANLYVCGVGSGGRLGTGDESTRFTFTNISDQGALAGKRIISISLGQNHSIAVSSQGEAFTWGSNTFGQLGYAISSSSRTVRQDADKNIAQVVPRQIFGCLKRERVVGGAASSIHSALFTRDALYTFGKNEGQLGLLDADARILASQTTPRRVGASLFSSQIHSICCIDKATICLQQNHEVFVFANHAYTRLTFTTDVLVLSPRNPAKHMLQPSGKDTRTTLNGHAADVVKIAAGGSTICAMTSRGDIFTSTVLERNEGVTPGTPATSSKMDKVRCGVTIPQRTWSPRKSHMAATDVSVSDGDGIVLCTAIGSVWRRVQRTKDESASNRIARPRPKDHKYSRVPALTGTVAVRSNTFGAFAAVRRDCNVLRSMESKRERNLGEDVMNLSPISNLGFQDKSSDDWGFAACEAEDVEFSRHVIKKLMTSRIPDLDVSKYLACRSDLEIQAQNKIFLVAANSEVHIPVHGFLLTARSPVLARILQQLPCAGDPVMFDFGRFELGEEGKVILRFQATGFISLIYFVICLYADAADGVWHTQQAFGHDGNGFRLLVMEMQFLATSLEMPQLDASFVGPQRRTICVRRDLTEAIKDPAFFEDGDLLILLDGSKQLVHRALVCQRCDFFKGLFHGRANGEWLAGRRQISGESMTTIDLSYIKANVFDLIIRYLYTDVDEQVFDDTVSADLDEFLDFVIEVLGVANELLLDDFARSCQRLLGKHVTMRNVCSILNAVAPCSVSDFRDTALGYIIQNLEGMLEARLLDELDPDLMHQLSSILRRNQSASMSSSSTNGPDDPLASELRPFSQRHINITIDQAELAAKLRRNEHKSLVPRHNVNEPLEDRKASKGPDISPISPELELTPELRAQQSPILNPNAPGDMMFQMDDCQGVIDQKKPGACQNSPRFPLTPQNRANVKDTNEHGVGAELDLGSPATGYLPTPPSSLPRGDCMPRGTGHKKTSQEPWSCTPLNTSKVDLKDVMAQASTQSSSALSSALKTATPSSTSSPGMKMSQRERKRYQYQQQQEQDQAMVIAKEAKRTTMDSAAAGEDRTAPTASSAPWQNIGTPTKVSLPLLLTEERIRANATKPCGKDSSVQTPVQENSRQDCGLSACASPKPVAIKSRPAPSTKSSTRTSSGQRIRSIGSSESGRHTASPPVCKTPPRPVGLYTPIPVVQPVIPRPRTTSASPSPLEDSVLALSMDEIVAQQQIEKDILKDAVRKRSLVEIQEEQAFQQWWDREARKAQGISDEPTETVRRSSQSIKQNSQKPGRSRPSTEVKEGATGKTRKAGKAGQGGVSTRQKTSKQNKSRSMPRGENER